MFLIEEMLLNILHGLTQCRGIQRLEPQTLVGDHSPHNYVLGGTTGYSSKPPSLHPVHSSPLLWTKQSSVSESCILLFSHPQIFDGLHSGLCTNVTFSDRVTTAAKIESLVFHPVFYSLTLTSFIYQLSGLSS